MAAREPAVRFEGVSKRFPGVQALRDVTLEIAAGSCHALCGENGAGKSTLGRVLAGIHEPDGGRLFVEGREVRFRGPRDSLAAGVAMVHQELAACANLSVAENLCLHDLPSRRGVVRRGEMRRRAEALLAETGTQLDVSRPLGALPIAAQQMVQIAAAIGSGARIIVFDEPTSSLSEIEVEHLYALIGRLRARGITCVYVSHRMAEVFALCDTVSVLRDGRHVGTRPAGALTEDDIVTMMVGHAVTGFDRGIAERVPGEELLRADGLCAPGALHGVSLSLHAGEIVGVAGLVGAGRSEAAQALFGITHCTSGTMTMHGGAIHLHDAREAIALGIGMVPEDRKRQGLVLGGSAVHNLSLPILPRLSRLTWIDRARERKLAGEYLARLRVRPGAAESAVAGLSGGTQQKVVLARWLAAHSEILLLDEPTRGVDVAAKAEIHAIIAELAEQGRAVLLISSELPELLALCDRVMVLREGRVVGDLPRRELSQDALLRLMTGLPERRSTTPAFTPAHDLPVRS